MSKKIELIARLDEQDLQATLYEAVDGTWEMTISATMNGQTNDIDISQHETRFDAIHYLKKMFDVRWEPIAL